MTPPTSQKRFPEYPPVKILVELPHWMNRDEFCEYAAYREYLGKMPRLQAEQAAKTDLIAKILATKKGDNSFTIQEK